MQKRQLKDIALLINIFDKNTKNRDTTNKTNHHKTKIVILIH